MGRAFPVLSLNEFIHEESRVRLLKLRNPWGEEGEWMGDWSYYSDKWTPELKKQLKVRNSDKKYYFFITLQSYWDYFWQTSICAEHNE